MKRWIAIVLIGLLCFGLVACGDKDKEDKEKTEKKDSSFTVEDYLKTDDGKQLVENFNSEVEANGLCTADCYGEDKTLVFDAKLITEIPDEKISEVKQTLTEYLEQELVKTQMDSMKDTLKNEAKCEDPEVKIIYRNSDGSVLVEKTF